MHTLLIGALLVLRVAAQQPDASLQAVIQAPDDGPVGRTMILDASTSHVTGAERVRYAWYLGNQQQSFSTAVDALFTPEREGTVAFRLVIRATIGGQTVESQAEKSVVAYRRKIVVVADPSVPADALALHRQTASGAGVFVRLLQPEVSSARRGGEEALRAVIAERESAFLGADSIVLWTDGVLGLQALLQAGRGGSPGMRQQTVVLVTERSRAAVGRVASGLLPGLRPQRLFVVPPEALTAFLTARSVPEFLERAQKQELPVLSLAEAGPAIRPWNPLSTLVQAMLTRGVSSSTVILLLLLPVIATILSFLRQVIGVETFGLFAPSIIALSFLSLGWGVGLLALVAIVSSGYATRALMRKWHLLHIPKVAIILTVTSVILLLIVGAASAYRMIFARDAVFILLIMSTLSESFLAAKTEQGFRSALLATGETIGAALLAVFVVQWPRFQALLLAYPELILLTVVANLLLGRWTGLRLLEYVRFRDVFRHLAEESE